MKPTCFYFSLLLCNPSGSSNTSDYFWSAYLFQKIFFVRVVSHDQQTRTRFTSWAWISFPSLFLSYRIDFQFNIMTDTIEIVKFNETKHSSSVYLDQSWGIFIRFGGHCSILQSVFCGIRTYIFCSINEDVYRWT